MKHLVSFLVLLCATSTLALGQVSSTPGTNQTKVIHPMMRDILENEKKENAASLPIVETVKVIHTEEKEPVKKHGPFTDWNLQSVKDTNSGGGFTLHFDLFSDMTEDEKNELKILKETDIRLYTKRLNKIRRRAYRRLAHGDVMMFIEKIPFWPPKMLDRFLVTKWNSVIESSKSKIGFRREREQVFAGKGRSSIMVYYSCKIRLKPMKIWRIQI